MPARLMFTDAHGDPDPSVADLLTDAQRAVIDAKVERMFGGVLRIRPHTSGADRGAFSRVVMSWSSSAGARQQVLLFDGWLGPVSGDQRTYR